MTSKKSPCPVPFVGFPADYARNTPRLALDRELPFTHRLAIDLMVKAASPTAVAVRIDSAFSSRVKLMNSV